MNFFKRKEGTEVKSIEEILSLELKQYLIDKDFGNRWIDPEIQYDMDQDPTKRIGYFKYKKHKFPFDCFSCSVKGLDKVLEAGKLLIDSFWDNVKAYPHDKLVIIRDYPRVFINNDFEKYCSTYCIRLRAVSIPRSCLNGRPS